MTEMQSVEEMLRARLSRQVVLKTMPRRSLLEQEQVWSEGLAKMQNRIAAMVNRSADALIERVTGGAVTGLFYDPLDVAEAYVKDEVRRSRSREEGERKRQRWLMDVLVAIGAARVYGARTLADYPPAADLMNEEDEAVG